MIVYRTLPYRSRAHETLGMKHDISKKYSSVDIVKKSSDKDYTCTYSTNQFGDTQ